MNGKKYVIYCITTGLLEEAALIATVLWLLPGFGVNIPLWGLVLMAIGLGVYSYLIDRLSKEALDKKAIVWPDIGNKGTAITRLTPGGYVKISNELWKASSVGSAVDANEEIVIVGTEGMTLLITSLERASPSDHGN